MNKKDVIFLCQFFYPEYVSSATLPYDIAKKLSEKGYSVDALCGYPNEYNQGEKVELEEEVNGLHIKRVKYAQFSRKSVIGRLVNYFSFTFSMLMRVRYLKKYKVAIVFSNPPILPVVTNLAHKFYGTKFIFVSYDIYPEIAIATGNLKSNSIISKFMMKINKYLYTNASAIVALSNDMKNKILDLRPYVDKNKIKVIPNWYKDDNTNNSTLEEIENKFGNIDFKNNKIVSYFGNLGTAQDLDTLLDVIRYFNKINEKIIFLFAGHGNKFTFLREVSEKEKLNNIIIFDFLHGTDYEDALFISDILVVTLAKGVSGLAVPSKTYGYLHAGKNLISVMDQNTDIAEMIKKNSLGINVEYGDTKSMIEYINKFEKRSIPTINQNSHQQFKKYFTEEKCTDEYVKLLSEIGV